MSTIRKTIRKVGSSKGIIFNSEECKNHNININDVIDIEIKKINIEEKDNDNKE